MGIRAVVFDIGGVLELASASGGEPAGAMAGLFAEWDGRLGLAAGTLGGHLTVAESGARTEAEMQTRLATLVGVDAATIGAFMDAFWDVYMGEPNTALIAYLRGLCPAYQTAILSNSFLGAREREEARYHFAQMVDFLVYSHEEGIAKPDRVIFERTIQRMGVEPEEIVFIDDVPRNIAAASEMGIQAVRFRDTAQAVTELEARLRGSLAR